MKKAKVLLSLQKLTSREIIKMKNMAIRSSKEETDKIEVEFLPEAESVLQDILMAKDMFHQVKYAELSEEEIEQYEVIADRIRNNVQRSLK